MKKLPIGIQSIQEIITKGYIYVHNTPFVLDLIQANITSSLVLVVLASPYS